MAKKTFIPTTAAELAANGEPQLSNAFMYEDTTTRDELVWFYWYSVAKPAIEKSGVFNKREFDGVYEQCLEKYKLIDLCAPVALTFKYMALKEAKEICFKRWFEPAQPTGTRLLRDCFNPEDGIWG